MQIILASANQKKIDEMRVILSEFEILSYRHFLDEVEMIEDGKSFEENAMLKRDCIAQKLRDVQKGEDFLVLADDSGLCVDALGGMPGIYSARFAFLQSSLKDWLAGNFIPPEKSASDEENNLKLIESLKTLGLLESKAFFVCVIAVCGKIAGKTINKIFRGECRGKVIQAKFNAQSFGYDPLFVPEGYCVPMDQIIEKNQISHRFYALEQLKAFLKEQNERLICAQ